MKTDQNKIYDMFLKETNVDRLQKVLSKYELFKKLSTCQETSVNAVYSRDLEFLLG